jgi:hypothetical protein
MEKKKSNFNTKNDSAPLQLAHKIRVTGTGAFGKMPLLVASFFFHYLHLIKNV